MNPEDLRSSVMSALASVKDPGTGRDIVSAGVVQNLEADESGSVRFQFQLGSDDASDLLKKARSTVEALESVSDVKINVQLPQVVAGGQGNGGGGLKPGSVPAPTPKPGLLSQVSQVIAVSSGKGGVGKSMVAANLAAVFAKAGHRVGLVDADIYGPNIPLMFGVNRRPSVTGEKGQEMIDPIEAHGVRLMSLGFLLEEDQPAIMRGPLISGILKQFLEQVDWGSLDIMIVDMPPGTGDAQLTMAQRVPVTGAVIVSTPQDIALLDAREGLNMFRKVDVPVFGIVENMSYFLCPDNGKRYDIFGHGGAKKEAERMGVDFLGEVPIEIDIREMSDKGTPITVAAADSQSAENYRTIAGKVWDKIEKATGGESRAPKIVIQ